MSLASYTSYSSSLNRLRYSLSLISKGTLICRKPFPLMISKAEGGLYFCIYYVFSDEKILIILFSLTERENTVTGKLPAGIQTRLHRNGNNFNGKLLLGICRPVLLLTNSMMKVTHSTYCDLPEHLFHQYANLSMHVCDLYDIRPIAKVQSLKTLSL